MILSRFKFYWLSAVLTGVMVVVVILAVVVIFFKQYTQELPTLQIGGAKILVELALTPEQQRQGLSDRDILSPGTGMLFVFSSPVEQHFWMKDMKFALDFIWINHNQVIQIDHNILPPSKTGSPKIISSGRPITMVLEVPAGWAGQNKIKVGDKIRLYIERYF